MTMVEDKETRVRSAASLSADYATIVPIKKRRFPIVPPPSPPPEDSCPSLEPSVAQSESASALNGDAALKTNTEEGKLHMSASSHSTGLTSATDACANQDKLEPLSVKLSLTNGECSFDCSKGVRESVAETTDLCTDRSNWDLNTTMDVWEGSASEGTSVSTESLRESNVRIDDRVDAKLLKSYSEISRTNDSGKHALGEVGVVSSVPLSKPQAHDDSLKLGLQMPFPSNFSGASPLLYPRTDLKTIISRLPSACSSSSVASVTVKSEPLEDPPKLTSFGAGLGDSRILGGKVVKHEVADRTGHGISQKSDCSTLGLFDSKSVAVKSEPFNEAMPATMSTKLETPSRGGLLPPSMLKDSCSNLTEPLQMSSLLVNNFQSTSHCSKDVFLDSGLHMTEEASENADSSAPKITEANEVSKLANAKNPKTKPILEPDFSSKVNVVDCAIDREKLDVPARDVEGQADCGHNANGGHPSSAAAEKENGVRVDNEYEDGEVQDQPVSDLHAEPLNSTPFINVKHIEDEPKAKDFAGASSYHDADSSFQNNEASDMQLCSDMEESPVCEKTQKSTGLETHLEDLSDVEVESKNKVLAPATQESVAQPCYGNSLEDSNIANISGDARLQYSGDFAHDGNAGKAPHNISIDDAENNDSVLPNIESFVHSDAVGRDSNAEINGSRIINLSSTLNVSSPGKTSSASDRSVLMHDGRKRLPNVALEGDRMHLRGRDEVGNAEFRRFSRERNREMFYRNSRPGFLRDRGRVADDMCTDWESEQDFSSEMHDGPMEFRASQYRYNSDYRSYNVASEEGFVGTGRGARKIYSDHSPNFHSQHSMRRAHGGRDGPAARGPHIVGRVPRNMSPSRCIGMDDSDFAGVSHGFVRRERNIGSFTGKGLHRIHSKSPGRLRSRSPIQWQSPRRRSPDGFVRHPDMASRRSPPVYRRDREGSPDRACFRDEVMMRRQDSPHYDMREMNAGRDHGFSRSMMHSGNSSGRGSFRTRRYDMMNLRERTQGEYYRVPMRGARFNELPGDENTDERRRMSEKRGPVRHFRPSCGSDNKGFSYNSEDSSRSYRLCQEDDSVYHEGRNSRERPLDRFPKNESGDAHKQRKVEDQEGSFRHGGSDEFDGMPRYKRERF